MIDTNIIPQNASKLNVQYQEQNVPAYDANMIRTALNLLVPEGATAELRVLNTRKGTVSGYFNDMEKLAHWASYYSGKSPAVYITLNPVKESLLARYANRVQEYAKYTTSDPAIVRRIWLGIDLDPKRDSGISSTEEERAAALKVAMAVIEFLSSKGWPGPILSDSGNGYHLLYRIDLPNDAESRNLIENVLKALGFMFSNQAVEVDLTTFNASRIWKLYGTMACKGDNVPDRPHRLARIIEAPETLEIVTTKQLQELADMLPKQPVRKYSSSTEEFNLRQWIIDKGLSVKYEGDWNGGHKWILNPCPFNSDHTDNSAYIVQFPNGGHDFGCHHNGCNGRHWADLREMYEPDYKEKKARFNRNGSKRASMEDVLPLDAKEAGNMVVSISGGSEVTIPKPYKVLNNTLIRVTRKVANGEEIVLETMVSRITPILLKELSNVERNSVHYEIVWNDRGRDKREIIPARALATKKDLLTLADSGLPVNDLNYKFLIDYFDKFRAVNQLPQSHMVERLGHVKGNFVHPLGNHGLEIVPSDLGEKQILDAFATNGTAETWKTQVFDKIKTHPKTLFMVLASFASVILQDLKVSPFIIDLSGSTSQGKTTALQVARSVWGTEGLVNEWNATRVAIERKAGFLNSFPLYMDDTRKADERILQSVIYQFSGGKAKGRGSLTGSQKELTWNNILISTGEISLSEYASKAGGAAARAIPLTDQPFTEVTPDFFAEIYKAVDKNYGVIGLEFLQKWQEEKEELLPHFYTTKENYQAKASGNEVLTRLSMYYAAVHFAGIALEKIFQLGIDFTQLFRLFDEIAAENKAIDKPKELLEEILLKLDALRDSIYYKYAPKDIKAIYHFNTICLMPNFLKEHLGAEEKMVRKEWLKRGFIISTGPKGKEVDYKLVKHSNHSFRVVVVDKAFIDNMELDFDEIDH